MVDGQVDPARSAPGFYLQFALENFEIGVGRNHVDVVGLDPHALLGPLHRHASGAAQDFGEKAAVSRIEMLDQDVRHAGIGGERVEELREGFHASGGSPEADYRIVSGARRNGRLSGSLPGSLALGFFHSSSSLVPERRDYESLCDHSALHPAVTGGAGRARWFSSPGP